MENKYEKVLQENTSNDNIYGKNIKKMGINTTKIKADYN